MRGEKDAGCGTHTLRSFLTFRQQLLKVCFQRPDGRPTRLKDKIKVEIPYSLHSNTHEQCKIAAKNTSDGTVAVAGACLTFR